MGLYYWTYRNHPLSTFEFCYEGIVYAQSSHIADSQAKQSVKHAEEYQLDIGVLLITPIKGLLPDNTDETELSTQELLQLAQHSVTDDDIREVGDRQQALDEGTTQTLEIDVDSR